MNENISLLTNVSNNETVPGYTAILVCLWIAVAAGIIIVLWKCGRLLFTRNTYQLRWCLLCASLAMFVSILLISVFAYIKSYAGIPVEMWAGLMTIGCMGILYTLIGCIIKLVNHSKAKQYNVSERVWCKWQQDIRFVKKMAAIACVKGLHKITSRMTLRQKSYFYRRLISTAALLRRIKLELKVAKKDLLSQIDEMIKNLKESDFSSEQTKEEE